MYEFLVHTDGTSQLASHATDSNHVPGNHLRARIGCRCATIMVNLPGLV